MDNAADHNNHFRARYCSVPECENVRGSADRSIAFFRAPVRGSGKRRQWVTNLFSTPELDVTYDNLYYLCQLHFNPDDIEPMKAHGGKVGYKLKPGALPLPIKKPADQCITNQSATEDERRVYAANNVTLIDIHQIRMVDNTTLTLDKPDQETPSNDSPEPDDCVNCTQLNEELQRARMVIRKLARQVKELKSLVAKKKCDRCGSSVNSVSENDAIEHLCEEKLTPMEAIKFEACETVLGVDSNDVKSEFMNETKLFTTKSEAEQSISSHSIIGLNEPDTNDIVSTNPMLNQRPSHKYYQCGICNEAFQNVDELSVHMRAHKNGYPSFVRLKPESFECYICHRTTKSMVAMRKHIRRHFKFFKCDVCNKRSKLSAHLCGSDTDVQCEYCPERFRATADVKKHLDIAHKTFRQMYGCSKCPKFFAMVFFRDCHQASHSKNNVYKCDMCPRICTKKTLLANHKKRLHTASEKSFLCEDCGKSFQSPSKLESHKRVHAEPTFQCLKCPKKFTRKSSLKLHSNVHSDVATNYVCDQCGHCSLTLKSYKKHKKRHARTEADRRYACKFCPQKFFEAKVLKAHEDKKHMDGRQFQCDFCESSYKYKGDLDRHLRIHMIDGKIYECPTCQMRFKYFNDLQKHSFEHYNEGSVQN